MSIFYSVRPFGAPRIHMDENAVSAPANTSTAPAPPIVREAPKDAPPALSASDAGRMLAEMRRRKVEAPAAPIIAKPAEPAAPAAPAAKTEEIPTSEGADDTATEVETELSADADNADSGENPNPGENEGNDAEADKLPPVSRPRSWAKEDEAEWAALPRSLQEKIAAREDSRDKAIRTSQNDVATKAKAVTAKEQAAEQARTQYESKLASVREILENEQRRDFPDIKSQQDLDNMSARIVELSTKAQQLWATDPLAAGPLQAEAMQLQGKLQAWDNHQRKLQGVAREQAEAEQRKSKERVDTWTNHVKAENAKAAEKIPDLKDADKGKVLRERAAQKLSALGFSNDELSKLASGEEKISVFDHRLQQLLHFALRLDDIQKAKQTVAAKVAKVVPPVVRPGTPQPGNPAQSQNLKALSSKLTQSGSLGDAVALLQARRGTRR